jgi:hypothetical protein
MDAGVTCHKDAPKLNSSIELKLFLTLVILNIMLRFDGLCSVLFHNVIQQSRAAEQAETSGTAQYAADHVFGGFVHPVTDGVLEFLIPDHRPCRYHYNSRHIELELTSVSDGGIAREFMVIKYAIESRYKTTK